MQGDQPIDSPSDGASLLPSGTSLDDEADSLAVKMQEQLCIDFDKGKARQDETGMELAHIFKVSEKELTVMEREEKKMVMMQGDNEDVMRDVMERIPQLSNYILESGDVDMETRKDTLKNKIKVRHCGTHTNVEDLLAIKDLAGWWGKLQLPY